MLFMKKKLEGYSADYIIMDEVPIPEKDKGCARCGECYPILHEYEGFMLCWRCIKIAREVELVKHDST